MTATPEFVPARTPAMKQLFMSEECGHVVASVTTPRHRCIVCDPNCESVYRVTWYKLYTRRHPERSEGVA